MARFLFVVPPLTGHVNPTISVAAALAARGHAVAWCGHPTRVRPLLPAGAALFELEERVISQDAYTDATDRARDLRGIAAFKFLWEDFFVPLARTMSPGVDAALGEFKPDVVISDQQALAGGLAARRAGLPWATFATTSAGVTDPLEGLPKVQEWLDGHLITLQREAGLPPVAMPDRSPHLVVVFSTLALVGSARPFPDHYAFVGPSIQHRAQQVEFPFGELGPLSRVLVSLGTVNAEVGARFYAVVGEALADAAMQVILVAPDELAPSPVPPNFIVRRFVPQLALLPHMNAVVCHGGHNTVAETLAHGLPLVVLPIKDDQPVVADQVQRAGAGVRLKFGRAKASELREAVQRVLTEPSFGAAARTIQASFAGAGGEAQAATRLEALIGKHAGGPA